MTHHLLTLLTLLAAFTAGCATQDTQKPLDSPTSAPKATLCNSGDDWLACDECGERMLAKKGRACTDSRCKGKLSIVLPICDACTLPAVIRTYSGRRVCHAHLEQALRMGTLTILSETMVDKLSEV